MSVEYSAVIVVGLPRAELEKRMGEDCDFDDTGLDQVTPYYDGGADAIIGVTVKTSPDYAPREITESLDVAIAIAKADFTEQTRLEGRVFLMPHGR